MDPNQLTSKIIGAAIRVHEALGPGLLESVYLRCLVMELESQGLAVQAEVPVPITYRGQTVHDQGLRIDILVEDAVVVELKSVETVLPVHKKQLLTYLRLTGKRVGLLLNFNVAVLKDGITRVVDGFEESLP